MTLKADLITIGGSPYVAPYGMGGEGGAIDAAATRVATAITTPDAGSITTAMLADEAVTSGKLGDGAVTTAKIAVAGVTEEKIADFAVGFTKMRDRALITVNAAGELLTAAQVLGAGIFKITPATPVNITLPTATDLTGAGMLVAHAACPIHVVNLGTVTGAEVTILPGTDMTIVGNAVVFTETSATFMVLCDSGSPASSVTVIRVS